MTEFQKQVEDLTDRIIAAAMEELGGLIIRALNGDNESWARCRAIIPSNLRTEALKMREAARLEAMIANVDDIDTEVCFAETRGTD